MRFVGLIIVAIICIIYVLSVWNRSAYEDYLYGFWVADEEFCEKSEATSMLLFLGEKDSSILENTRPGYLVITDDMCNQGMTLKYSSGWAFIGRPSIYTIVAHVEFDQEQIWPEEVTIEVDMTKGTLLICSDDTVFAQMTKSHDITNLTAEIEAAQNSK